MSDEELVSVVIPAFDVADFVADAISSVLAEAHRPLEIIVVDDGSHDDTARIAESFGPPVTCIRQANAGPAAARNRGIAAARGAYLCFLDADDLFVPGRLTQQLDLLRRNPTVEIVLGGSETHRLVGPQRKPMVFEFESVGEPRDIQLGRGLYRRSVFDRIGLLDESLWHCEDWDWFTRARETDVQTLLHDEAVQIVRRHETNITHDQEAAKRYRLIMLKRSIDRRRDSGGRVAPLGAYGTPVAPPKPEDEGRS